MNSPVNIAFFGVGGGGQGGEPVVLIRGANAPLIRQTILEEIEKEKQVQQGLCERVTVQNRCFLFADTLIHL